MNSTAYRRASSRRRRSPATASRGSSTSSQLPAALPKTIVVDNGPEFISNALDKWAYERGVTLHFIKPGTPTQNAFIESFNGSFRNECLNANWFDSLDHAREVIEAWRLDYNAERPHSSLGGLTPIEYQRLHTTPARTQTLA
jgi:transposase InsO family protein